MLIFGSTIAIIVILFFYFTFMWGFRLAFTYFLFKILSGMMPKIGGKTNDNSNGA